MTLFGYRGALCKFRTVWTVVFIFMVFEDQRVTDILSTRLRNLCVANY
jgi:hypothetical protein